MRASSSLPLLFAFCIATGARAEAPCEPAVAAVAEDTPVAWRDALSALVRSSSEPSHPWSCGGGRVELKMHGATATLIVLRRGDAPTEREVASPEDVVPIGQALLSLPRMQSSEPAVAPQQTVAAPSASSAPVVVARRLVVGAFVGPRRAGGSDRTFVGAGVSAGVPISTYVPSVWGRYERASGHRGPGLSELCVGAGVVREVALARFDLRAGLTASAAVMQRDLPRPRGGDTRIDGRMGAAFGASIPVMNALRVVGTVDAELAPGRSRDTASTDVDGVALTPFPFYTVGALVGVELSL